MNGNGEFYRGALQNGGGLGLFTILYCSAHSVMRAFDDGVKHRLVAIVIFDDFLLLIIWFCHVLDSEGRVGHVFGCLKNIRRF